MVVLLHLKNPTFLLYSHRYHFSVMEQSTGYVKVLVGGRGDKNTDRGLNRATDDVARQPGSSIKPLVAYGPGLDTGAITLASAIDDAPYYYSGTDARLVKNYTEGEYLGYITVRAALTRSQNVPAISTYTNNTSCWLQLPAEVWSVNACISTKCCEWKPRCSTISYLAV